MMQISHFRQRSLVKILSNTLLTATVLLSLSTFAQDNSNNNNSNGSNNNGNNNNNNNNNGDSSNSNGNACLSASSQIRAETAKIGEACKKAGINGDCTSSALACEEVIEEESPSTWSALGKSFGINSQVIDALTGASGTSGSNICPQMNAKDYREAKKDLDQQIRDTNKDIADLNKQNIEDQKAYDDRALQIKKDLDQAEKDLKAKKRDIAKREREQIAELMESQQKANKEMRTLTSSMLDVQSKMAVVLREKATNLLGVSAATAKASCHVEINKLRAEYTNLMGKGSNYMTDATRKRAMLINTYNTCMEKFNIQRAAIIRDSKSQIDKLQKQLDDLKAEQDNLQDVINLANTQLEEIKKANEEEGNDELEALIKKNQDSQTELSSLYTETQSKLANNQAQLQKLDARLDSLNAQLTSMGPVPKGSTYTPGDAASDIASALDGLRSVRASVAGLPCQADIAKEIEAITKKHSSGSRRGGTR